MIPVFRPLKDPAVATVWSGLAASTIGEDLFRVAVVWIAAEQIGNAAGYVNATQYAAMLVVGLLGASAFDRWRPDRAMIGAKYASAVMALLPVLGFYIWGISIPLLVASVMGLAGLRMVFTPALQSAVPVLVTDRSAMQAINGLFDATWRLARLIGPLMAAILNTLLPVIHFLTITAVGFVLSAVAIWVVRDRLIDPASKLRPGRGGWRGAWDALLDGARLMLRERTTGALLLINAFANGPWSVALQLCIALMVVEHDPHIFGFHGLASLGLIVGSCGVGDVLGNLIAGSVRFRRPLSTMFLGYVAMGAGFALIALGRLGPRQPLQAAGDDGGRPDRGAGRAVLLHPDDHPHADGLQRRRDRSRLSPAARHHGGLDAVLQSGGDAAVRPDRPDPYRVLSRPAAAGPRTERLHLLPAPGK
jgi:DHA3 family macrolide efflux protein-like MFS transporter